MSEEKILDEEALGTVTGGAGETERTVAVTCECGAEWSVPRGTVTTTCPQCERTWRLSSSGFKVPCYDPE